MEFPKELITRSQEITKQVLECEKTNKPIEHLVKEQIKIMEQHHDAFVKQAEQDGIDNIGRARIEVKLYNNMKTWARKIGLSTEKYDNAIHNIRVKFLGEENTKKYFNA